MTAVDDALTGTGPVVARLLDRHFGSAALQLPVVSAAFATWDHVNLQAAVDAFLARADRQHELLGVLVPTAATDSPFAPETPALGQLLAEPDARLGAPDLTEVADGPGTTRTCVGSGLVLVHRPEGPVALWLRPSGGIFADKRGVDVQARTVDDAQAVLDEIAAGVVTHSCFRRQLVQFAADEYGRITASFDVRPSLTPDQLVLPAEVRRRIERHALGVALAAPKLAAAGRHLKRGLLLHGPPGTGKTHTIRYLLSAMPEATVFLLVGQHMAHLRFVAARAAELAPAVIVLDDVDLIAEDRNREGMSPRRHLFDLLDAMDGMGEDTDVLFICTTNRPEALEPAIAARPGRIDQAVEIATPDASCRAELLALYGRGLDLRIDDLGPVLARTDGVTASFLKELVRRSAVIAVQAEEAGAGAGERIVVGDVHVAAALDALLDPRNPLTAALLGGAPAATAPEGPP